MSESAIEAFMPHKIDPLYQPPLTGVVEVQAELIVTVPPSVQEASQEGREQVIVPPVGFESSEAPEQPVPMPQTTPGPNNGAPIMPQPESPPPSAANSIDKPPPTDPPVHNNAQADEPEDPQDQSGWVGAEVVRHVGAMTTTDQPHTPQLRETTANPEKLVANDINGIVVPEDVKNTGARLGFSAEATAGLHYLSASHLQLLEGDQARREQRGADTPSVAKIWEEAGRCVATAEPVAREIMREMFVRIVTTPATLQAVANLADLPGSDYLMARPELTKDMAQGVALHGAGEVFDSKLRVVEVALQSGLLQSLNETPRDASQPNFVTRLLASYPMISNEDAAAKRMVCITRNNTLIEAMQQPGFREVTASEFGKHILPQYVLRTLLAEDPRAWLAKTADFLRFATDRRTYTNLELLAANNPEVLGLFSPDQEDVIPIKQRLQVCAELAIAPRGALRHVSAISSDLALVERLRFAQLYMQPMVAKLFRGVPNIDGCQLAEWLMSSSTGNFMQKAELLEDPEFVSGLKNAVTPQSLALVREARWSGGGPLDPILAALYGRDPDLGPGTLQEYSIKIFTDFYKKFGLDYSDLLKRWLEQGETDTEQTQTQWITDNLKTMEELEQIMPGVCCTLRSGFFIRHFARYDQALLLRQAREIAKKGPHAMTLFGSQSENQALIYRARTVIPILFDTLRREYWPLGPEGAITPRIYEPANPREVVLSLRRSITRYGPAVLGYIAAHGRERVSGTNLGNDPGGNLAPSDVAHIMPDGRFILRASNHRGIESVFLPGAPVILDSCFGGLEERGPGRIFAAALNVRIYAPPGVTNQTIIDAEWQLGKFFVRGVEFYVKYRDDIYELVPATEYDGTAIRNNEGVVPSRKEKKQTPGAQEEDE